MPTKLALQECGIDDGCSPSFGTDSIITVSIILFFCSREVKMSKVDD